MWPVKITGEVKSPADAAYIFSFDKKTISLDFNIYLIFV